MTVPFVEVAATVTERVLNAIPGGLLIAAFTWLVLRVSGRQNSRTRFAAWFTALLAVAGLPFLPSLGKSSAVASGVPSEIVLPGFWAGAIFSVWILIAALAMTRIVAGLWKLRALRRCSLPLMASGLVTANFTPEVEAIVTRLRRSRGIVVRSSSAVAVPTAIGFFRPVILIPDWVLQELSAEELKVVLLHEFAHLRRLDDWTNLLQKLVRTVFFFHPAVWWIERRLSLEREMACDEVVLAQTENRQAYAECLVSLAEKSFVRRGLVLAQAVIGRARDTSLRIAQILGGDRPNAARIFRPAFGLAAVLAACGVVGLSDGPRLIAFRNASPAPVTTITTAALPFAGKVQNDTSGAKAHNQRDALIAAVNRCATQSQDLASCSAAEMAPQARQAAVVPVSALVGEVHAYPAVARTRVPKVKSHHPGMINEDRISEARAEKQQPAAPPEVVFARANIDQAIPQPQELVPSQFVIVTQTTHYDEQGSAIVRLCVWRVSFDGENRRTVQEETIVRVL